MISEPAAGPYGLTMAHTTETVTTPDGASLFRQTWTPDRPPTAVVCLVHGLGEHSGRYAHVARRWNDAGYAVIAQDLRGHGKSSGTRGDTRIATSLDDVDRLLAAARAAFPGLPVVLYGHSMGGLVVLTHLAQRQPEVAAVVASAPPLHTPIREQKAKVAAAKVLGRVAPSVTLASGLDADGLSRDPEVVRAYLADPLVHDRMSLGLGMDMMNAMDALMAVHTVGVPLLVIHGSADPICLVSGSREWTANAYGDVTYMEYEGLLHESHNEPEQAQVIGDVIAWTDSRLAAAHA